jgi:hypothetical protein
LKNNLIALSLALALILSACGPLTPVAVQAPAETAAPVTPTNTPVPEVLPTPVSGGGLPAPVLLARADLAARLNLPPEQIEVTDVTPKDWSDACLELPAKNETCAQIVTAGFQVVMVAGAAQYQYHTDAEGKNLRLAGEPIVATGGEKPRVLLEWTGPTCEAFSVSTQAAFFGKCGQSLQAVPGFDPGLEPVSRWVRNFAAFEAETPAGKLKFNGLGSTSGNFGKTSATPAEQRSLSEWARLQFEMAQSGRSGAAWGLSLSYHREGGIAGFCDDVGIYLDGRVLVSSCKGLNSSSYLTASELAQVYAWFDGLKALDYEHADPAAADGMKTVLNMPGQGQKSADDATVQAMLEFASGLAARAAFTSQAGPDQAKAGQALVDYLTALNSGDYTAGAKLYGGPTDLLQTWNPDIKNDLPALLERACKQNGLVCMLPRSVTYRGPDGRGGYQFLVELNQADGSLFTQGPCCGETSGPSLTSFLFSVLPNAGGWMVMDLPPYVP